MDGKPTSYRIVPIFRYDCLLSCGVRVVLTLVESERTTHTFNLLVPAGQQRVRDRSGRIFLKVPLPDGGFEKFTAEEAVGEAHLGDGLIRFAESTRK